MCEVKIVKVLVFMKLPFYLKAKEPHIYTPLDTYTDTGPIEPYSFKRRVQEKQTNYYKRLNKTKRSQSRNPSVSKLRSGPKRLE